MNKLLKLLKRLQKAGVATAEEKAEVAKLFKALDEDDAQVLKEDVDAVADMPEPAADGDDDDAVDEELEKGIKTLVDGAVKGSVKSAVEVATENIKNEVKSWLDEQKEALSKKAGLYHPDVQEKRAKMNEYVREFSKALLDNDTARVKELSTDATGSPYGGYVVDSELSAEIRHLVTEYGVARREMSTIALSKNSYKANELVTDVTVFWVDEGTQIDSTQVVLDQETLSLKKLGAIVTLTRELLEDQEIDLFSFIAGRVAEGFAQAEDEAFFIGDGTATYGSFTGILNASGVVASNMATGTATDAFTDMTADDLLDMIEAAPQVVRRTGKFYMHHSIMNIVRKLKDDQGEYIFQRPSEAGPARVWGRPVVEVEVMPSVSDSAASTKFVIFGDLSRSSIFGYRNGMAMDRFNAGVVRNIADSGDINLITTDREAVRWVERVGVLHIIPGAVVVMATGATA